MLLNFILVTACLRSQGMGFGVSGSCHHCRIQSFLLGCRGRLNIRLFNTIFTLLTVATLSLLVH